MSEDTRPNVRHYNSEDKERLKKLIQEGVNVKQEVKDLNDGLNDTIKAIAEELEIEASQLKKVITIAHKNSLQDERAKFEQIEDILETVGYK